MSNRDTADRILIYSECNQHSREAVRVNANRYLERYHPSRDIFLSLVGSLRMHGSFANRNGPKRKNIEPNEIKETQVHI